jgi:hypothetical protein
VDAYLPALSVDFSIDSGYSAHLSNVLLAIAAPGGPDGRGQRATLLRIYEAKRGDLSRAYSIRISIISNR